MEVLVFGGTAEGRRLVEWLDARGSCDIVACTVTDYGASLLPHGSHVTSLQGPLSDDDKRRLMEGHDFACIVDATHPFARHISQSVVQLAASHGKEVVRVVRESSEEGAWTRMPDAAAAATLSPVFWFLTVILRALLPVTVNLASAAPTSIVWVLPSPSATLLL